MPSKIQLIPIMFPRGFLPRLLPLCICLVWCIQALTISPTHQLDNQPASSNFTGLLNEPYECFDAQIWERSRRAKISDCYRAMASLPNYHRFRVFANGEGDRDLNPYLLPYTQTRLGCQIKVELTSGASEESSWLSINMATNKILNACQVGYSQQAMTGGWTRVGNDDRILVTVEKAQKGVSQTANASDETSSVATA